MVVFGAVLLVLCTWLLGRAILPSREVLPRDRWEEQCMAYLLGASALPLAAMALSWLGLSFAPWLAWTMMLLAGAVGLWRVLMDRSTPLAPSSLLAWQKAFFGFLGVGSVLVTLSLPLNEFDPIFHYAFKGKVLFYSGDVLDPAFTGMVGEDGQAAPYGRIMTHPNYPLGIPFLEAFAAHAGFAWSDRWVQFPLAFWALCLPGVIAFGLRPFGRRPALFGAMVAAATPMLYARNFLADGIQELGQAGLGGSVTLGGGGDLPLAVLFAGSLAMLIRALRAPCRRAAAGAGLCLAGALFMKNEGLAMAGCLVLALLIADPLAGRRAWLLRGIALLTFLVCATPWLIHRGKLPAIDENYGDRFRPSVIAEHWQAEEKVERSTRVRQGGSSDLAEAPPKRRDLALTYFWREFTDFRTWGLLWALFLFSLPWTATRFRLAEARWLSLLVLGGLVLYFLILLITPWFLVQLRGTGIPERLMLHLLGPAAMAIGLLWWEPRTASEKPAEESSLSDPAPA